MNINKFPKSILCHIKHKPYKMDKIGKSDSKVIIFDDFVLKIEKTSRQADREYDALRWLNGRLPVPEIIEFAKENGFNYLLMSRIKDINLCDDIFSTEPERIIECLADGIKQLWSINIDHCPLESRLSTRLTEAKYRIENDLVDVDDFNDDTLGEDGFESVDALYSFLLNNQPSEDLVFTHGDYCLPNYFVKENKTVGFIDLSKAGIADRWQDLALCIRSLKYNLCELRGLSDAEFIDLRDYLLSLLNIKLDSNKLKYYILLDELF